MENHWVFEVLKQIDGPYMVEAIPPGRLMTGYQISTAFRIGPSAPRFSEYFKFLPDETARNNNNKPGNYPEPTEESRKQHNVQDRSKEASSASKGRTEKQNNPSGKDSNSTTLF